MKKIIVLGLIAFGVCFVAYSNGKIELSPKAALAGCDPECLPPK